MNEIVFFTTGREQGNARSPRELSRILNARRIPGSLATAEQVHQAKIAVIPRLDQPKKWPGVDGLVTDVPDQPLGIYTADCAPVFLTVPKRSVVGVVHAGWRGVRGGIVVKMLQLLRRKWHCRPSEIHLQVGPCIGPCCFEVRWDVARYFSQDRRRHKDRWVVDLPSAIRRQARRWGLPASQIRVAAPCTAHHRRFYSYRRDKTDARQISVVVRKEGSWRR